MTAQHDSWLPAQLTFDAAQIQHGNYESRFHFWRRFTTTIGSASSPFDSAMVRP
jgi:hypothetical protein